MSQQEKHFKFKEKVFGQFFTPPEVSDFIVSLASLSLERKGSACDPACGDGVFLHSAIKHGFDEVVGVDVDEECLKDIPIEGAKLLVGDSLQRTPTLDGSPPLLQEGYFDLVVGNPPFSAKYGRVRDRAILSSYKLGFDLKSQAIEALFLERFIQLAKNGGVVGIILPDGIFLNLNYRKVREFILNNSRILAVVSLPRAIFDSSKSTTSKTSILFVVKGNRHEGDAFMAEARSLSELDRILGLYRNRKSDSNALWVKPTSESLHPKIYLETEALRFKLPTLMLRELIKEMFCGRTEYGEKRRFCDEGIRFISAKVVTPLGIDFSKEERKFVRPNSPMDKKKAHVRVGDILFVRVGVGCIGRASVVVDEEDLGVADDWIYIMKTEKDFISPYYLAVFIQSRYGRVQIDLLKRGVGTVTIPQKLLKEIVIPLPSTQLQEKIEQLYEKMVKTRRRGFYDEARRIYGEMMKYLENQLSQNLLLSSTPILNGLYPHLFR